MASEDGADGQLPVVGEMELIRANLLRTLITGQPGVQSLIDVSYQSEPLLGFLVPVQMREFYAPEDHTINGTAMYRNFRRFGVQVEEALGPLVR